MVLILGNLHGGMAPYSRLHATRSMCLTLSLVFPVLGASLSNGVNLKTLQFVQILFRHGDRTQIYTYPNSKPIPEGETGKLTDVGRLQEYELGRYLRTRYEDAYISKTYVGNEISVVSSDLERTIESARMLLAGLYGVNISRTLDSLSDSTPDVPIRIIPEDKDNLIRGTKPCPRFLQLFDEQLRTEYVNQVNLKYQDLIAQVNEGAGTNVSSVFDIAYIGDILEVERVHGLELPEWGKEVFERMQEIYDLNMKLATSSTELQRLKGGPLLSAILRRLRIKGSRPGGSERVMLYSGHDEIMISLKNCLSIVDPTHPPYAAALIMELHQSSDYTQPFLEIHYRNDTHYEPYSLVPQGCGSPCFLDRLIELTRPVIPRNWEKECKAIERSALALEGPADPLSSSYEAALVMITLIGVAVGIVSFAVVAFLGRKKLIGTESFPSYDSI